MEAHVEIFLLNVMGSAAVASAVVAGAMSRRLSSELAGLDHSRAASCREKPGRNHFKLWP
jgi:hypothetical protein